MSADQTPIQEGQWAFGTTREYPGQPAHRVLVVRDRGAWKAVETGGRWADSQLTDMFLVRRPADGI